MAARRPSRENDHLPAACQGCWKTDTPVYLRATMAAGNLSREETQHGPLTSVTPEEETQKKKSANTRVCVCLSCGVSSELCAAMRLI